MLCRCIILLLLLLMLCVDTSSVDAARVAVVIVTVVNVDCLCYFWHHSVWLLLLLLLNKKQKTLDYCFLWGGETWRWSCRGRDGQETHRCLQLKYSLARRQKVAKLLEGYRPIIPGDIHWGYTKSRKIDLPDICFCRCRYEIHHSCKQMK